MRISVSGSEGFIGRHLVARLRTEGYEIRELDRKSEDFERFDTLKDFVFDSSVIVHLAGKNRATDAEIYEANVLSVLNLLLAMEKFGQRDARILYASSMQVYKPTTEPTRLDEHQPLSNGTAFSNSKILGEQLLQKWTQSSQISSVALRIANAYGPGCRPFYNSVIATFLDQASKGKNLIVNGGSQTRDFIFIDDVVAAISSLIPANSSGFQVFNVATGKANSIYTVAQCIRDLFPSISICVENEKMVPDHLIGDPTKIKNETGFVPKVELKEGLRRSLVFLK